MFKFVKSFADVASHVSSEEYSRAAQRLTKKEVFGFLIQDDVEEKRVWMVTEISGEGKDPQYGVMCLNNNGIAHFNMLYVDYYVPELRDSVIHIDQSYGRVSIASARTISRTYSDISTCYNNREWDGTGEAPKFETRIITPAMVEDKAVAEIAGEHGLFILHSDLNPTQMEAASAVLEFHRRVPVLETVVFQRVGGMY